MKLPDIVPLPRFRFALFSTLAALALAGCGGSKRPASALSDSDRHMLDDYEQIRAALAADDARIAKKAAIQMVTDLKPADPNAAVSPLLEAATGVADAQALDTMRQRFETLSDRVVPVAKGVEGYYVMTSDLPNTVPWVQQTGDVDNPFFGKAMHRVGEPVK